MMNIGLKLFKTAQRISLQANSYSKLPSELVVFIDDKMVVCWHPEQTFPYECSKPLPIKVPKPESVLKVGEAEVRAMFNKTKAELIPEELAKITYTAKHRWYPRARDKKAKITPPDRPYL